jgi:predicted metal-dependent phosphoesterase TrpH
VIDLHLHTTASDGLLTPEALVARAARAGLRTIGITDHDTTAGLAAGHAAAAAAGIALVDGIEITAVQDERDVHILGYFFDRGDAALARFLADQRDDRVRRVREMAARLDSLDCEIDVDRVIARAREERRTVGRPLLADALVAAGHAASRDDAFARLLGRGCPAFVPRRGADGADVVRIIHAAGGLASLAHPGLLCDDGLVERLAGAGLDAIEAWHADHSPDQTAHYAAMAARLGVARSGGSDFHGDPLHPASELGLVVLPPEEFAALAARARAR